MHCLHAVPVEAKSGGQSDSLELELQVILCVQNQTWAPEIEASVITPEPTLPLPMVNIFKFDSYSGYFFFSHLNQGLTL